MNMEKGKKDIIMQNKIFLWMTIGIFILLSIPFLGMIFSNEVNWNESDFMIIGVLLFVFGSLFIVLARKFKERRIALGIILGALFLLVWAELAVGIFTSWGS